MFYKLLISNVKNFKTHIKFNTTKIEWKQKMLTLSLDFKFK